MPEFVTIPNVEIASTGIEYPLSTGLYTCTEEDLVDACRAFNDPAIRAPRVKIGYMDAEHGTPIAEPAFGTFTNLRLENNNQVLVGDMTDVPVWLAEVLPVAYPSRSMEANRDCETVTGNKYRLVITAVTLLGITMPGITTLADLPKAYGVDMPVGVEVEGVVMPELQAAVNIEDVRREYYAHLDAQEDSSQYTWWWIRAMQLGPNELIVDDDDGHLYRVPFTVRSDKVTFGEAQEVKVVYEDVAATTTKEEIGERHALLVAGMAVSRETPAVYATRAESRPAKTTQKGVTLDPKELRASLGLPESATDEQVAERITGLVRAESAPPPEGQPAPAAPQPAPTQPDPNQPDPEANPDEGEQTPAQPAPNTQAEVIQLDRQAYEELRNGAALATRHEQARVASEDTATLDAAILAGKIPPARRKHYQDLLNADREGTVEMIKNLAPGLVPVQLRGTGGGGGNEEDLAMANQGGEGLPDAWIPEAKRIRARAAAGYSRVTKEQREPEGRVA